MKNRKCPNHKACWDYGDCESCELGQEITRLHKRIDRLKKKLEKAERASTADVVEVKHGEWICISVTVRNKTYFRGTCSVCGITVARSTKEEIKDLPYCHCGARMDGERCENDE